MSTIESKQLEKVKNLYSNGYSAREIAQHLNTSIDAVYYFFRSNGIPRRSPKEQNRVLFERKKPSFALKEKLTIKETELFIAGVMLYWGEGSQWDGEVNVDFANSKPEMIKVFVRFLRVVCAVNEKRLRCYLYCYSNQDVRKLVAYWSTVTNIPTIQFTKPYIRKDFDVSKINKMPYGLIHIRYSDKKLLLQLREWIKEVPKQFEEM